MDPIEVEIRNAIAARGSHSNEARNRLYQTAQLAIDRMPDGARESAQKRLFAAIKSIEEDYIRKAMAASGRTSKAAGGSGFGSMLRPAIFDGIRRIKLLASRLGSKQLILGTSLSLVLFLAVWFIAAQTDTASSPANTQDTESAEDALRMVFSVDLPADLDKVTTRGTGPGGSDGNGFTIFENKLIAHSRLEIRGRDLIPVEAEGIYVLTVWLEETPAKSEFSVMAGVSTHDAAGNVLENGEGGDFYFANEGPIEPSALVEQGIKLIGVLDWDVFKGSGKINAGSELVKPVVIIEVPSSETRVKVRNIALHEVL